jgi:limonene-1,2-epoxide hydrolase
VGSERAATSPLLGPVAPRPNQQRGGLAWSRRRPLRVLPRPAPDPPSEGVGFLIDLRDGPEGRTVGSDHRDRPGREVCDLSKVTYSVSNDARTDEERFVLRFFDDWSKSDTDLLRDYFTDDAVYSDSGQPARKGKENIRAHIAGLLQRLSLTVETLHLASRDGIIFSERVDYIRMKSGRSSDLPVAGVIELRDGKIASWHDYFDGRTAERELFGDGGASG